MSTSRPRPAILVIGMHRSGTSAMTRVLDLLGADAGPAPDEQVWEQPGLIDLHERVLSALGLDGWADPSPLPAEWWADRGLAPLRAELAGFLTEGFAADRPWVLKDPRLCRLAPLWWPVLKSLGRRPVCVLMGRHPSEVAASLQRRDDLDPARAHALWLRSVLEADALTRRLPRVTVTYTELLADWRAVVRRVREGLELTWPRSLPEAADEIEGFLDPAGRHHRFGDALDWEQQAQALRWPALAWEAMQWLAAGQETRGRRRLTAVRKEFEAAQWLWSANHDERPADDAPRLYTTAERWDHGQHERTGVLDELVAERTVAFDVAPHHHHFCGFDLLVGTYDRRNTCSLQIVVLDDEGETVVTRAVPASALADNDWHPVRFPPQIESRGRTYRVEITSPDGQAGNAFTFYCDDAQNPTYRAYYAALVEADAPATAAGDGSGAAAPSADTVARLVDELAAVRRRVDAAEAEGASRQTSLTDLHHRVTELRSLVADDMASLLDTLSRRLHARMDTLEDAGAARVEAGMAEAAQHAARAEAELQDRSRRLDDVLDAHGRRFDGRIDELAERLDATVSGLQEQLDAGTRELGDRLDTVTAALQEHLARGTRELDARLETALATWSDQTDAARRALTATDERLQALDAGVGDRLDEQAARLGDVHRDVEAQLDGLSRRQRTAVAAWKARLVRLDLQRREDHADLQREALRLREDHVTLRDELTRLRASLGSGQAETATAVAALERTLHDAERRLGQAARRVEVLQQDIAAVDARVDAGFDVIRQALDEEAVTG